jgi:hypothetical protein
MDPEVWYLQALLMSRCQHTVLQHHLVHILNWLTDARASKVLPHWLRITGLLNAFECGNRSIRRNWINHWKLEYLIQYLPSPLFLPSLWNCIICTWTKKLTRWVVKIHQWQLWHKSSHKQYSFPLVYFTSPMYIYQVRMAILLLQMLQRESEQKVPAVCVQSVTILLNMIRTDVCTGK